MKISQSVKSKTPKLYIRDTGILHALLGIAERDWYIHPAKGASFEGFVIEEIIRKFGQDAKFFFWRTQVGAEIDLLMIKNGKRYGFEVKYADVPPHYQSYAYCFNRFKFRTSICSNSG